MQETKQPVTLGDLGKLVKRRWKAGCIALLVTIIAAVGIWAMVGTKYAATAVLTVSPMTTNPFSTAAVNQQINIATERAILGSGEVARMAAASLGENVSAATLVQNTSIEAPQGSQVLSVTVVDRDPERAARHANALATAYLAFRAKGAADVANTYIEAIDKRIAELDTKATKGSVSSVVLTDLVNQRNDLSLVAENPGRVIGVADGSATPSTPGLPVYLAAGLFGGLITGLVTAVSRDRLSRKTGTAERLAAHTGRRVLRMEDTQDTEGVRWIIRFLRIGSRPLHSEEPTIIGILGLGEIAEDRFRAVLAHVLAEQEVNFRSESLAAVAPGVVDRGWPTPVQRSAWSNLNALLLGFPSGIEDARIAVLCDRVLSSAIVFVDDSADLASVDRRLAVVDGLPPESVCLVFVNKRHRRGGTEEWAPKNRGPAEDREPAAATMAVGNAITTKEEYSK
ncbi:YveK family protein [Paeniglutamicibacter psychrophenolicus]|uniref:YveK family protein n=1 Tax=Paeniglutamicibacter psychrophenolicus TaxID=257454 RepID=UPI002789481B|nr:hypothetical protein [Paeniglutamicibacter psychrophenolicus]MDQ0092658.1 capsular polysaccharide biosynthesis protein [Paeniglutamicibacter psychrophenolicus]